MTEMDGRPDSAQDRQTGSAKGGQAGSAQSEQAASAQGERTGFAQGGQAASAQGERTGFAQGEQAVSAQDERTRFAQGGPTGSAQGGRVLHALAFISLVGLVVLCVGWELWWAPLRPGGTLLALKAVPLLFAVKGVLRARLYTMQWLAMLSLLYLMEGVVRAWSDPQALSALMGGVEVVLALVLYLSTILYVRPAKKAAKAKNVARTKNSADESS